MNEEQKQGGTEVEYLGLADLARYEEELVGFVPEADANARLPLPPKATYMCKWTHREKDPQKLWIPKIPTKGGATYLQTDLIGEIIENPMNPPEWVGRKINHRVSTQVMGNSGTTTAQMFLQGVGLQDKLLNAPRTNASQAMLVSEALMSEPAAACDADWRYSKWDDVKKENVYELRGMRNFPKDDDGKPTHIISHPTLGEIFGWLEVRRFVPPAELAKTAAKSAAKGPDEAPAIPADAPAAPAAPTTPAAPTLARPVARGMARPPQRATAPHPPTSTAPAAVPDAVPQTTPGA